MRYTVTTFKVRLEASEVGDRSGEADDVEITKRLKECGEMLAIRVLDHVILGADHYYSFSDRGLL